MRPYQNIWGHTKSLPQSTLDRMGAFVDIGDPDIGEGCSIQTFVSISPGWKIGNRVFFGPGVRLLNDKHPNADIKTIFVPNGGVIEDDVSIGGGSVILPGVTLHKGCVIGAGAVVTKSVPAGETWVGNPAKQL